jgi:hypothetical protein
MYIKVLHNIVRKNKPTRIEKRDTQKMWDKKRYIKTIYVDPKVK